MRVTVSIHLPFVLAPVSACRPPIVKNVSEFGAFPCDFLRGHCRPCVLRISRFRLNDPANIRNKRTDCLTLLLSDLLLLLIIRRCGSRVARRRLLTVVVF